MKKNILLTTALARLAMGRSHPSSEKHPPNENVTVPSERETYQFYDISEGDDKQR